MNMESNELMKSGVPHPCSEEVPSLTTGLSGLLLLNEGSSSQLLAPSGLAGVVTALLSPGALRVFACRWRASQIH